MRFLSHFWGRSLVEGWLISHDYISLYLGGSKDNGTPKSSILMVFSIINHPFWGIPIFGNTHIWHRIVFAYINSTHVIRISGMIGMIVGCSTSPTSTHTQPKEYHCIYIYICVFIYVYIYIHLLCGGVKYFLFLPLPGWNHQLVYIYINRFNKTYLNSFESPPSCFPFHKRSTMKRTYGTMEVLVFFGLLIWPTWWCQRFFFSSLPGKWSNLTNIFQMGWNHQLVAIFQTNQVLQQTSEAGFIAWCVSVKAWQKTKH